MLRKVEEEKKAFQAKTCRLVEEKATTVAEKEKTEEETAGLRQKLQDLWAGFATQKEDLEVNYQKQVDDMFFYGYQCCMKKHGIAKDTPNLSSNDENDEFLGSFTQWDGPAQETDMLQEADLLLKTTHMASRLNFFYISLLLPVVA